MSWVRIPSLSPIWKFQGPLAQLVEQLTLNQLVVGSNPTRPTNNDRRPGNRAPVFFLSTRTHFSLFPLGRDRDGAARLARESVETGSDVVPDPHSNPLSGRERGGKGGLARPCLRPRAGVLVLPGCATVKCPALAQGNHRLSGAGRLAGF